jgi:uncharacterized protein YigE (DUF2233 family)
MTRRQGRRLARVMLFTAIVGGGLGLVIFTRHGAHRGGGVRARPHVPAGGVAQAGDAGGAAEEAIVEDARRYAVRAWSFGLERYDLVIEDAAMTTALDTVLTKTSSELVVNGGFFDPDGRPVGLAMSDGVFLSRLKQNLSGGVLTSDGKRAELFPSEGFTLPEDGGSKFAIQCRPRLVVDRSANVKSDDGKRAERTALCTRDGGRIVDVVIVRGSDDGESPGPSLFALAKHLALVGCEAALNLDGGPSTGVAWREGASVRLLAPRNPVRHVVAFRERR